MTLAHGSRLGPYQITAKLGQGGMGEVWRATDSRLEREVAIKVLSAAFTADRERLARFEREAKLLAQLHHPNIASIFGLEEADGTRAIVMELVDGDDLAARIARGPIPIDEALPIAHQIAAALEAAHERGIVHRDLKPANVKLRADGTVKVLDFGLAKALDAGGSLPITTVGTSPTLTADTRAGMIVGTAAYMAPEQARGAVVDKRADLWAFGAVLYEMLTGRPLFHGETVSDTLAEVLKSDIDLRRLPPVTPPALRSLLRRCLERNVKNRLHDIADVRIVLDDIAAGRDDQVSASAAPAAPARRSLAATVGPGLVGLALGALAVGVLDRTALAPAPTEPAAFVSLTYSGRDFAPTASPDGKTIAFSSARDGRARIWVKQLATGEEVAITAGPNDLFPVFSPDGSSLLFLRGLTQPYDVYRVAVVGGEARRVTRGTSASWSPDGRRIAVTRPSAGSSVTDTVFTMNADGGGEHQLAKAPDLTLVNVRWSPDGRTIGVWAVTRNNTRAQAWILALDADTGDRGTIYRPPAGSPLEGWAWSGPDAVVVSQSITQSRRGGTRLLRVDRKTGVPTTLVSLRQPSSGLDVLGDGRIVIDQATGTQNLGEWPLDASARAQARVGEPRRWLTRGSSVDRQPIFSPDGRRVLFNSDRGGNLDLWELALETGSVRPLIDAPGDDWDPAYTADGKQLLWSSNRGGNYEIWTARSDGSAARKLTADGVDAENASATPDGSWVYYTSANPAHRGLWKVRFDGSGAQRVVAGSLLFPEVSPDGCCVAYGDLESNRLVVIALADGARVAELTLPAFSFNAPPAGRSRWLHGTSTLAWTDFDAQTARIVAQEIVPGRDTSATRRVLVQGPLDAPPESFALAPDGASLVVSVGQLRSELLLVEGLPGVRR
jgi:Tol biopolymer transport system component